MSDKKRTGLWVWWAAGGIVFGLFGGGLGLIANVLSVRTDYVNLAKSHPVMGWSAALTILALALLGLIGQHLLIARHREAERDAWETKVRDWQEERLSLQKAATSLEQRAELAEGEVETLENQLDEIRNPRRVRADVKLVEETLGDLKEGTKTRGRIVGGFFGPKFFHVADMQALWLFSDRSTEAMRRIHDEALCVAVRELGQKISSFHDVTYGNIDSRGPDGIDSRGPDDPGRGDYVLTRDHDMTWDEFYKLVREVERKGGEIGTALQDVELRLYQLRTDYLT